MFYVDAYLAADALQIAIGGACFFGLACWALSLLTKDYSWVDRLWSLSPPLFALHFAGHQSWQDPRLNLMAGLAGLWGARLTYNFARKGGYTMAGEDYRWKEMQGRMGPFWFAVLNATFIAPFQNLLLLLLVVPAYAASNSELGLGALDLVASLLFLFFLGLETLADEQQWRFQQRKKALQERGDPTGKGFIDSGLFRYSRHPNFFAEQALWWSFYLFSVASGAAWLNLSIIGAALLTALFQGSTRLTEEISARKYSDYPQYIRSTSRLMPWFPAA